MELRLYRPMDGKKSFVGTLAGYDDGNVTITVGEEALTFEKQQIAKVNLHVSF